MSEQTVEHTVSIADAKVGIALTTGPTVKISVTGVSGGFLIETTLTAAGGTPLANEKVSIIDSDTDRKIMTVTSDENGVVRARVPRKTEYHFFVESAEPEEIDNPYENVSHSGASHDASAHPMLYVELLDASGKPVANESVTITDPDGNNSEASTDEGGVIDLSVTPGVYKLKVRGTVYVAHTVFSGDFEGDRLPYRFTLA